MIPNIFHFIFGLREDFGGKPFNICHYLAIESAFKINNPSKIYFYCAYKPEGEWFEKIEERVEVVSVTPPISVFGNTLHHVAHQTDVLRLDILKQYGGIYLDIDTICVKPFTDLLDHDCVLGQQLGPDYKNIQGLCNAVILASPESEFINLWYETYKDFRSKPKKDYTPEGGGDNYDFWDEHSVYIPQYLSKKYEKKIHITNYDSFHYPIWDVRGIKMLFEETHTFNAAYCHHLWESATWNYLNNLTIDYIKSVNTTYNKIARKFI